MRATIRILIAALGVSLAGCSLTKPTPEPKLDLALLPSPPPMPHKFGSPCHDPGVPAGAAALNVIAQTRVSLAECDRKRAGAVWMYGEMRAAIEALRRQLEQYQTGGRF